MLNKIKEAQNQNQNQNQTEQQQQQQQQALPQKTIHELEIDQLNLDSDQSQENSDNIVKTLTPELVVYDPEKIRISVIQTFARQSYSNALAFVEVDFYDKLAKLTKTPEVDKDLVNRRIGQFVSRRIDKLLEYAVTKSDRVMDSLSLEERDLYVKLCEAVTDFRNILEKKLRDE